MLLEITNLSHVQLLVNLYLFEIINDLVNTTNNLFLILVGF